MKISKQKLAWKGIPPKSNQSAQGDQNAFIKTAIRKLLLKFEEVIGF
jgi:hypothetical protein